MRSGYAKSACNRLRCAALIAGAPQVLPSPRAPACEDFIGAACREPRDYFRELSVVSA